MNADDRSTSILALWLAEQRATSEDFEERKREAGAGCPVCGVPYHVRYGRHESAYFLIHPIGTCPLAFDSHHAGAQTEQEALAAFSRREDLPRLGTPAVATVPLPLEPAQDSGPAVADENFVLEAAT